jgi:hypothetical protein
VHGWMCVFFILVGAMRICHRICAQSCWTCGFLAFSPCAQLIGEWDSSFGVWRMQCRCCHLFLYYVGLLVFAFLSRMFVVFRFHSASIFLVSLTLNKGRSEWLTHILSEILGRISISSCADIWARLDAWVRCVLTAGG